MLAGGVRDRSEPRNHPLGYVIQHPHEAMLLQLQMVDAFETRPGRAANPDARANLVCASYRTAPRWRSFLQVDQMVRRRWRETLRRFACRSNEIQQPRLRQRLFVLEHCVGVAGQLQAADPFFQVGLVGFLMSGDFPPAAVLLLALVGRETCRKVGVDAGGERHP